MTLASRALDKTPRNNIYIKQSYVLLTWMTYIREVQLTAKKKKQLELLLDDEDDIDTPGFFIHPQKKAKLTFLKAPMAHKTFSQEQFINYSYNLTISFNNNFKNDSVIIGINNSIYVSLYLRSALLPTETNLLFLKRLRMSLTVGDSNFMSIK